jgi:polyisoprenoid-binding protein YceI
MPAATAQTATQLPVGTWQLDAVHSSASFSVKHMGVATFRSRFEQLAATLTVGEDGAAELLGSVRSDSIAVKDENFQAHLRAADFFDSDRYPELRFASTAIRRDGEQLVLDGQLTIKDQTHPVQARGAITDPIETLYGAVKLGITLETIIDRRAYGLNWNAPLPKGGMALANDVRLELELEFTQAEV